MTSRLISRHGGAVDAVFDDLTLIAPYFDDNQPLIELGNSCQNGSATQGQFIVTDPITNTDSSIWLPPHTLIRWTEDAPGCAYWLSQGRVSDQLIGRGDVLSGDFVEREVTVDDANVDLRGLAFTEDWVRPEETDTERMYALQAYILNGTSSTSPTFRPSTVITCSDSHLAPDTNTVTMPAKTYPLGTQPQEVADDCSTTAAKIYGVVIHHGSGELLPESRIRFYDSGDGGDALNWNGTNQFQSGGAEGSTYYTFRNLAPVNYQLSWAVSPGSIHITGYMRVAYSNDDKLSIVFRNVPAGSAGPSTTPPHGSDPTVTGYEIVAEGPTASTGWPSFDWTGTVPAGTVSAQFGRVAGTIPGPDTGISFDRIRVYSAPVSDDCSHLCLEYIKETDHSTYASTVKISDKVANWDPENLTDPVYEPIWDQGKGTVASGQATISGLLSRYGTDTTSSVFVHNDAEADIREYWFDLYNDSDSVNATQATARATAILNYRLLNDESFRVSVIVLPEQTYLLTAGMSLQIDTAVVPGGFHRGTYNWERIAALNWQPLPDGRYMAHMQLSRGLRNMPVSRGKLAPAATTPSDAATTPYDGTGSGLVGGGPGTTQDAIDELAGYNYLVGSAQPGLSSEIVVGTTPGGELGNTWASPTVDATHAGSNHLQPVRKNSAGTTFTRRRLNLIEGSNVTLTVADDATDDEVDITVASTGGAGVTYGTPAIVLGTAAANGSTDEAIRRDSTIVAFDATVPVTQAFSDAAATGSAAVAARRDHRHGMPAGSATTVANDTIWDAKGDIAVATAADTAAKLTVGSEGQILVSRTAATPGIAWEDRTGGFDIVIDGGSATITTGIKGDIEIPFGLTLTGWTLLADQSGAIKIDVWKDTLANFPPVDGDSITNGHEPEITASGTNAQDLTISDWTGEDTCSLGDVLRINVDSVTSIQRVTLAFRYVKH